MKRFFSTATLLSLSFAAVIGVSAPALAHSDEVASSPEQGSTVEAGRIPITLTFAEELLVGDDSISHEVVVTDAEGSIVPALCASAEGFELRTAAAIDQPGNYNVTWRTVSADGHPVSGSYEFKVVNTTDYDAATDAVDACVTSSISEQEPTVISAPENSSATDQANETAGWVIGISLLAAGAVAVISGRVIKARGLRRKNKSE